MNFTSNTFTTFIIVVVLIVIDRNFFARYINGNGKQNGIKILHWNPGAAYLENKLPEIESVIEEFSPHLFGISEANFLSTHSKENVNLEDYDLFFSDTLYNPILQVSRVVVYKHKSLICKLRRDMMSDQVSSIWLEVGLPHKPKILVCNFYREHQYLNQADALSLSPEEQLSRWGIFIQQWEAALATGMECLVLGDGNVDHLQINTNSQSHSRHNIFIKDLVEKIYPHGVKQCIDKPTHSRLGQNESLIDILYTNSPERLTNVLNIPRGSSHHNIIAATRLTRIRYVKKRNLKYFNKTEFRREIRKLSWWDIYTSTDVNVAVESLTSKINSVLDKMAPIKIFQNRQNYAPWLSKESKDLIKERDI